MNGALMQIKANGEMEPVASAIGSDEHRIELARWVLDNYDREAAIYKKALKVLEAYLAGKPLPKANAE